MSKYARKPFPELFIDKVCNAALRNFLNWTPAQAQFCELRQIFRSSCFIEQVWITNSVVFTLENKSILKDNNQTANTWKIYILCKRL